MIPKNDENLLEWIFENATDFTDENNTSTLIWASTNKEALRFIRNIPQRERVRKYGIYYSRKYLFRVAEFDDIGEGLEKGVLSENICRTICAWNREAGRENRDMSYVGAVLYPAFERYVRKNYLYVILKNPVDPGVLECLNPKVEHCKLYRITEKGEIVLEIE